MTVVLDSSTQIDKLLPKEVRPIMVQHGGVWRKVVDYCAARYGERVTDVRRYRLTAALFEAAVGAETLGGIGYPSALSEALGINYALLPQSADERLKLVDVLRIDFQKNGNEVEMRPRAADRFHRDGRFEFHG